MVCFFNGVAREVVDLMGVKIKTTLNNFPDMKAKVESLNGRKVKVGVLTGEHRYLAAIHEY
jgi:hypothetical protein